MTHPSVIPAPIEQHDRTGEGTPTASVLVPAAAHQVIAARLSGDTQCSDEAAGLYIDTVTVGPEGVLEVTVSDEHGASLAVTLASPGQPWSAQQRYPHGADPRPRRPRRPGEHHRHAAVGLPVLRWTSRRGQARGLLRRLTAPGMRRVGQPLVRQHHRPRARPARGEEARPPRLRVPRVVRRRQAAGGVSRRGDGTDASRQPRHDVAPRR